MMKERFMDFAGQGNRRKPRPKIQGSVHRRETERKIPQRIIEGNKPFSNKSGK